MEYKYVLFMSAHISMYQYTTKTMNQDLLAWRVSLFLSLNNFLIELC